MIEKFEKHILEEDKSKNTIKNYLLHIKEFLKWYRDTYDDEMKKLYRKNVLEFKNYLQNVKGNAPKSINVKISSLIKFNEFLQQEEIQDDIVVSKSDFIKVQEYIARPGKVEPAEIEKFIQRIMENENKRNYAMIMLMANAGLRISEVTDLKLTDLCLVQGKEEVVVTAGKGEKFRVVPLGVKVAEALKEYIKERNESKHRESKYLFVSQKGNRLDRTVLNIMFQKYSDEITPHELRHYFCTHALEVGFGYHEVAAIAGHSNIHTTLRYTNPSRQQLHDKMNLL